MSWDLLIPSFCKWGNGGKKGSCTHTVQPRLCSKGGHGMCLCVLWVGWGVLVANCRGITCC